MACKIQIITYSDWWCIILYKYVNTISYLPRQEKTHACMCLLCAHMTETSKDHVLLTAKCRKSTHVANIIYTSVLAATNMWFVNNTLLNMKICENLLFFNKQFKCLRLCAELITNFIVNYSNLIIFLCNFILDSLRALRCNHCFQGI